MVGAVTGIGAQERQPGEITVANEGKGIVRRSMCSLSYISVCVMGLHQMHYAIPVVKMVGFATSYITVFDLLFSCCCLPAVYTPAFPS